MFHPGIPIYVYVAMICIVAGLISFSKLSPPYLRLFIPFLAVTVFVECVTPLKWIHFKGSNHWFFNLFTIMEFAFYGLIYFKTISGTAKKKYVVYSLLLGLAAAFINIFFIQGFEKFHTISYRICSAITISWCILYFRQLLQLHEEIRLVELPMFWFTTGIFFFSLGFFFYMNAFDYIVYRKISFNQQLWKVISRSLNMLLYSCFLIGFLCQRSRKTSFSSS